MKPCVFIQTNHKQMVGALVAQHALKRNSKNADKFDVHIIHHDDYPYFAARQGQRYLRDGVHRKWNNDDLQSFTLTRFMPPELMGYKGRAVVIDPDVFALGDVWELFTRDMGGKAIMACRPKSDLKGKEGQLASSVMLLDCAKLKHWKVEEQFNALFAGTLDYMNWISLKLEPRETIGILEPEWNHFDKLTPDTRMIHNTKRRTQPWKAGLPVDFMTPEKNRRNPFFGFIWRMRRRIFGDYAFLGHYRAHPDRRQEQFFFALLKECLDNGTVSEGVIANEMHQNHVRHDALEVLDKTPALNIVMAEIKAGGSQAAAA